MNQRPRVSVLMPVYNGAAYLAPAIESVLQQTLKAFELVIVDDASTDGSVACIERYDDPRIRLWRNPQNMGQGWTMNKGLELSRAAVVARFDQDDLCLPDRLRRQLAVLEHSPQVAAVGTWMYGIRPGGRRTGVLGMPLDDYGAFVGTLLTTASPLGHTTVMYRRDVVLAAGGYDPSFAPCEDYELWCRLALRRCEARVMREPLVMWRLHDRQQSVTKQALQQRHVRQAHERLLSVFLPEAPARRVSRLLQVDLAFWQDCRTASQARAVLDELEGLLGAMRERLALSPRELRSLRRSVEWWLGRRACVAILHQQRQSAPVYLASLRGGWRALGYATSLSYPVCFVCSFLFVPWIRRHCLHGAWRVNRLRYLVRFGTHAVADAWQRLWAALRGVARRIAGSPSARELP